MDGVGSLGATVRPGAAHVTVGGNVGRGRKTAAAEGPGGRDEKPAEREKKGPTPEGMLEVDGGGGER